MPPGILVDETFEGEMLPRLNPKARVYSTCGECYGENGQHGYNCSRNHDLWDAETAKEIEEGKHNEQDESFCRAS